VPTPRVIALREPTERYLIEVRLCVDDDGALWWRCSCCGLVYETGEAWQRPRMN
jgi:hypothetical protein